MKVTDIMIGDWVKFRRLFDDSLIISQVVEIHTDNACIKSTFGCHWSNLKDIEPIPLTPEILEKNGWEERPTGYVFYTDGKRYDNSLWYIFDSNTFVVDTAKFQIKYLHELQHILKLCGIDKEIEL